MREDVERCIRPRRGWAICTYVDSYKKVCGAEVDTRWWAYGHAVHCFPREFRELKEAAFDKFYRQEVA